MASAQVQRVRVWHWINGTEAETWGWLWVKCGLNPLGKTLRWRQRPVNERHNKSKFSLPSLPQTCKIMRTCSPPKTYVKLEFIFLFAWLCVYVCLHACEYMCIYWYTHGAARGWLGPFTHCYPFNLLRKGLSLKPELGLLAIPGSQLALGIPSPHLLNARTVNRSPHVSGLYVDTLSTNHLYRPKVKI